MASKAKDKDVNEEGSENTMKEKGESAIQETVNEEYNVPANVEGFIELRGLSDSYDEIEFLGEEYNVPKDAEDSDVIVLDTQWTRSYDDDSSGDESYMGQSSSSDVEESLSDDFGSEEFNVEAESDSDEDGLGSENDDVSLKQLCVLPEAERSGTMPSFIVGMTFEDKKELKRAVDEYAVSRGVKLRTVRSDRKTFRVLCMLSTFIAVLVVQCQFLFAVLVCILC
ncbi:hypothetical protein QN277_005004 [Acacia crassicarpa]|uniref:Transposase MuDR plant domain-containing protein n=1 Tax=Acacia crassicarpa TaxID=499986 RepID=A0AAE1IVJ2_9FABA|nr:hypothetical protein QN277_005004 [Acacia crassicarpa]